MAKLYLKFKESVIREIILHDGITTIGRLEKNDIFIDNLAVSGSHARIVGDGERFVIEDLNSTNGTHVNGRRISKHQLVHNSVVTIGKHTLVFLDPAAATLPDSDQTVVMRKPADGDATVIIAPPKPASPPVQAATGVPDAEKTGKLTVIDGPTTGTDYLLEKRLVTIGKSETAEIRLKGFFAPKVAAVVNRTREGYVITPASGDRKLLVNGSPVAGAQPLKPFDIVEVASLRLQFTYRDT